jgi:hypothetical protein
MGTGLSVQVTLFCFLFGLLSFSYLFNCIAVPDMDHTEGDGLSNGGQNLLQCLRHELQLSLKVVR